MAGEKDRINNLTDDEKRKLGMPIEQKFAPSDAPGADDFNQVTGDTINVKKKEIPVQSTFDKAGSFVTENIVDPIKTKLQEVKDFKEERRGKDINTPMEDFIKSNLSESDFSDKQKEEIAAQKEAEETQLAQTALDQQAEEDETGKNTITTEEAYAVNGAMSEHQINMASMGKMGWLKALQDEGLIDGGIMKTGMGIQQKGSLSSGTDAADADEFTQSEQILFDNEGKVTLIEKGLEKLKLENENAQKQLGDKINAVKNLSVEPRSFLGKTTGAKITAAIAIIAGAIGGAMSGQGGNTALSIIQKAISDDINKQKTNIALKRESVKDFERNINEKFAQQVTFAQSKLALLRQSTGDAKVAAQAEQFEKTLQLSIDQAKMTASVAVAKNFLEQNRKNEEMDFKRAKANREVVKEAKDIQSRFVESDIIPGGSGLATASPEILKKYQIFKEDKKTLRTELATIKRILSKTSRGLITTSKDRTDLSVAANQIKGVIKGTSFLNLGAALTPTEDFGFLSKIIPTDSRWQNISGITGDKVDAMVKYIETVEASKIASLNIQPPSDRDLELLSMLKPSPKPRQVANK